MEKITIKAKISLYLDTRRELSDDTYPVKIQVFYGRQKLFNTGINVSAEDFANPYKTAKPKGERLKELKIELSSIEAKANEVVDSLKIFTFEKFEKLLFSTKQSLTNIIDHYNEYIMELDKNDQTGTSSSYSCSINSIRQYIDSGRKYPIEVLTFDMITPEFLNKYESWMIAQDNSRTTVGKAFWFFSYQCNGMNIRDISELKFRDLHGTYFSFLRHKTIRTTKEVPKPIIVPVTEYVKGVFDKYGNKKGKPNDYVFPIFSPCMDAKERHRVNQNFVRFINQHMKKLANANGMEIKGTMEARHSFTTK